MAVIIWVNPAILAKWIFFFFFDNSCAKPLSQETAGVLCTESPWAGWHSIQELARKGSDQTELQGLGGGGGPLGRDRGSQSIEGVWGAQGCGYLPTSMEASQYLNNSGTFWLRVSLVQRIPVFSVFSEVEGKEAPLSVLPVYPAPLRRGLSLSVRDNARGWRH